jgi:GAF domain-containing protein
MVRPRRRPRTSARTLTAVLLGTAPAEGEEFLRGLVRHLAEALGVRYAFVTECVEGSDPATRVRTLAFCDDGRVRGGTEWELAGTPCEEVLTRSACCGHPSRVQHLFPRDAALAEWGAESYLGVPLVAPSRRTLGHLAILDVKPLDDLEGALRILRLFAVRAAAELERRWLDAERERILARLQEVPSWPASRGLIPVCAWCRRIRSGTGSWMDAETYLAQCCDTGLTHGICPDCQRAQVSA